MPKPDLALEEAIAAIETCALLVDQLRERVGYQHPFLTAMLARDVLMLRFVRDDVKRCREV